MPIGYTYSVSLTPTALTTAITLVQVKAGAAAIEILEVRLSQKNLVASEIWNIQLLRKSAAATVTSATPLLYNPGDPASLAVGSTSGTGITATAEGTNTDITFQTQWNVLNGEWLYMPIPEARIIIPQAGIWGVKLNTAPSGSTNVGVLVTYREFR